MHRKSALHKTGFPPLADAGSRILILGSMPGERSLAAQQYYAHPRNLFWTFIAALGNEAPPDDYTARTLLLSRHHIALWDVCDACIRQGSLDSAILSVIPNDIEGLLARCPGISTVAFNGQKAAQLYRKYFPENNNRHYITLPSTSPANASIAYEHKKATWLQALKQSLSPTS